MDSRGWIQIQLIASFNRVRQLTPDAQLVRDVLGLSGVVEVREGWVRMVGWERFVLPDAPRSVVEGEGEGGEVEAEVGVGVEAEVVEEGRDGRRGAQGRAEAENWQGDADAEVGFSDGEGEEEEEEEVVFVMEREEGPWSPERRHAT
jgi:la-related protein 1